MMTRGISRGPMRQLPLALTLVLVAAAPSCRAFAADLAVKAAPKAPIIASNPWSGFYIGATAGYGFGNATTNLTPNFVALSGPGIGAPLVGPLPSGPRTTGFVGGGE